MNEEPAVYAVGGAEVSPGRAAPAPIVVSPADAEKLRRCEAWPVIGLRGMVDVRMPAALWRRLRGE